MCRNITTLRGLEPEATSDEIHAAARQYVRKVSGVASTSPRTEAAFERAVEKVAAATAELLADLPPRQQPPPTQPPLRRIAAALTAVAADPHPLPNTLVMLLRGLLRRCPRCGGGRLFPSWLRMVERCPRCGMRFERDEGYFLGAFVVNFGLVLVLLAAFIIIGVAVTLPNPPPGKLALLGGALSVVVPVGFYPFSRTFWSAIDLWLTPLEPHEIDAAGLAGMTPELGVTAAPLMGLGVAPALDLARHAETLGYRSFWTAEVTGPEAFAVLGAVASMTGLALGTGVLALQLRTPPLVAMAGATLQALAPDRDVLLGIGISSPVVAGRWHGMRYGDRPLAQVREFVAVLRLCLSGERVDFDGDFYRIKGFRLGVRLDERRPKIVIGALNERMLQLAGEVADGVLLNYLPSSLVPWSVEQVRRGGGATVYAYVHAGVGGAADGDKPARADLFSYATVDSYARNFTRAGYGDAVAAIREGHANGDRAGALAAVSREMIDGIDFMGDADAVRSFVAAYVDAGVERPILFPLPWGADRAAVVRKTLEAVAPG